MKLKSENCYKIFEHQIDSKAEGESVLEITQCQKERFILRSSKSSMKKERNANEMSAEDVGKAIKEFTNE